MRKLILAAAAALLLGASAQAALDPKNFDLTVKPQDDFYHFANGTWLKSNPIPAAYGSWGAFNELRDLSVVNLHTICERVAAKPAGRTLVEQQVGDFYASGMDEAAVNAAGLKPLQPELDRIAAIKNPADVLAAVAHLHSLGVSCGFRFGASPDRKNSDLNLATLAQGGLGLPERGYYFNDDEKSQKIRQQYVGHIAKLFVLLGEPADVAQVNAAAVMALETKLALGSLPRVKLRNPYASYHKMTLAAAAAATPAIDFKAYFAAVGAPAFVDVNLSHPDFFKGFESALASVPVADWRAYLRWHLLRSTSPYLSDAFVQEDFAFNGRILSGTTEMRPRWKRVVSVVDDNLGEALGQLYVADYFPPASKARMIQLVNDLRASLHDRILELPWMDDATKAKAIEKLAAFTVKIGYADKWRDYSKVTVTRQSYLANVLAARAFEQARDLAKINGPVDRTEWGMTPPTVNAYYSQTNNEIVFPAAILQPPFFDPKADDAVNYGGIGVVIGHEMTHGFDDSGRRSDAHGNLNDWWTQASSDRFSVRAAGIVKQFSGYTVLDGLHVNGELTQGENIADLGGLRVAYGALQKALEGKSRAKIDGYTPEQRFFLGYATVWRINFRPETLRLQVTTDPHSPGNYRANGPLSNLDEFAKAFDVPEGAPMRRPAADRVTSG